MADTAQREARTATCCDYMSMARAGMTNARGAFLGFMCTTGLSQPREPTESTLRTCAKGPSPRTRRLHSPASSSSVMAVRLASRRLSRSAAFGRLSRRPSRTSS